MIVCHLWPALSPFNVWDLPLKVWRAFAQSADEYVAAQKQGGAR